MDDFGAGINALAHWGVDVVTVGRFLAYFAKETNTGYWITRKDVEYAADCANAHKTDAYSHWCSGSGKKMSKRASKAAFGR